MNYVKSALAGLVTVVIVCGVAPFLIVLVEIFIQVVKGMRAGAFGIAFGPVTWHAPSLGQGLFLLAVFTLAFLWELRRLKKRQVPETAKF